MFIDPLYLIIVAPAFLLAMWAQHRVHAAYQQGMQEPVSLSGAQTARLILDRAGLHHIPVEETPGTLSDHYDPSSQTVRLSSGVYHEHSCAAVGIAAHEVGHALQHAHHYTPLVVRNFAVPAATWGPTLSIILFIAGAIMQAPGLIWLGIIAFSGVAIFQIINLPVEFDASNRAKRILSEMGIVDAHGAMVVSDVLGAAAWTYVAATLQSILTLLYYVIHFTGGGRRDE